MLDCQRHLFQLPADQHYLNCAYMSPLMQAVERVGVAGMQRKRFPGAIEPADFFQDSDRTRELFARLIGAGDPERIAILPSVSYGISTVTRNLAVSAGQNIVTVAEQFPSNVLPWRRLAAASNAAIRTVAAPDMPRGQALNERVLAAIDTDTAAVAVGSVHWTDGTRLDLEAIGRRAREVGAAFIIDGTQSVGAALFDLAAIQPDALICAGYKWLLGPYSIALGWFGPRFDGGCPLEETWLAREGSHDFRKLVNYRDEYRPKASRYDVGERSNFILLPMLNAALEQILDWGVAAISDYCGALCSDLVPRLMARGIAVEDEGWRSAHLFGLRLPAGVSMDRVRDALLRHRVHVSLRGDAVRVAPHLYNDRSDLEALATALESALPEGTE